MDSRKSKGGSKEQCILFECSSDPYYYLKRVKVWMHGYMTRSCARTSINWIDDILLIEKLISIDESAEDHAAMYDLLFSIAKTYPEVFEMVLPFQNIRMDDTFLFTIIVRSPQFTNLSFQFFNNILHIIFLICSLVVLGAFASSRQRSVEPLRLDWPCFLNCCFKDDFQKL
jgi:hypothetical protein